MQVDFMRRHSFDYEALAGEEYQVLKPDLVKSRRALATQLLRMRSSRPPPGTPSSRYLPY